jgi:hypothetical protein
MLDKFINHKDSKMKVTHKYNTKWNIKLVDVIFIICIKNEKILAYSSESFSLNF